jgi:hypothetical protein
VQDLEVYLAHAQGAGDVRQIQQRILELRRP